MDNEIPKYRKRSNKSAKKSKHKHKYEECLLKCHNSQIVKYFPNANEYVYYRAKYCTVCGKIGNVYFFEVKSTENGFHTMYNQEEIYNRYKDLPMFEVDDAFNKYVELKGEEEWE